MEDFDHLRDEWLDDPTFNALYFHKLFESKPSIYKDNFLEKITYKFFQRTKSDDLWKNAITAFSIIKESKIPGAFHGKKRKKCKKAFYSKILI